MVKHVEYLHGKLEVIIEHGEHLQRKLEVLVKHGEHLHGKLEVLVKHGKYLHGKLEVMFTVLSLKSRTYFHPLNKDFFVFAILYRVTLKG